MNTQARVQLALETESFEGAMERIEKSLQPGLRPETCHPTPANDRVLGVGPEIAGGEKSLDV